MMSIEKYIRYVLIIYSPLFVIMVHAQRISNLSIKEASSLCGFVHANGTAEKEGKVELIYPDYVDLKNVTPIVTYSSSSTTLKTPAEFPTDLSHKEGVSIVLIANNIEYPYRITAKKVKPLLLPFELKFGGERQPNLWSIEDESSRGWAGVFLAQTSGGTPRINGNSQLLIAFEEPPRFCAYTITFSEANWDKNNKVVVESSSTRDIWKLLREYNNVDTIGGAGSPEEDRLHGVDVFCRA